MIGSVCLDIIGEQKPVEQDLNLLGGLVAAATRLNQSNGTHKVIEMDRDKHIGKRVNKDIDSSRDNPENSYICAECGQSVFMGDLAEVFHHEEKGHKQWLDG